jgi:hypothetical protein
MKSTRGPHARGRSKFAATDQDNKQHQILSNLKNGTASQSACYNPSPPARDGTISCISYPSYLTVLLNSIIIFFKLLFHAGRLPQRPYVASAPVSDSVSGFRKISNAVVIFISSLQGGRSSSNVVTKHRKKPK